MTTPAGLIIMGIDPGSRYTGYGVIRTTKSGQEAVEFGVIKLGGKVSHEERLKHIYDELTQIVRRCKPDQAAIEMPVYGKNPQSMLKLGRAQAAAMLAVLNQDTPITQYTPKEVKRSVTGNGNAAKEQVLYMVQAMLNLQKGGKMNLDTSDALAVALCHAHRATGGKEKPQYRDWASYIRQNPGRVQGAQSKKKGGT